MRSTHLRPPAERAVADLGTAVVELLGVGADLVMAIEADTSVAARLVAACVVLAFHDASPLAKRAAHRTVTLPFLLLACRVVGSLRTRQRRPSRVA